MSEQALKELEKLANAYKDDAAYSKQIFTIGRQAHVRTTQTFGTPSLIWHVAFWPRRDIDPHSLDDAMTSREEARKKYNDRRADLATDLNKLLEKLQTKGRVPRAFEYFEPGDPADWESDSRQIPVKSFLTESISFTIWWSDEDRETCPQSPSAKDLRVRVQADIHPDFATITFVIDAGKPWNEKWLTVGEAPPTDDDPLVSETVPGNRRKRIFHAARSVRAIGKDRLDTDPSGAADILPETGLPTGAPEALLRAGNLLYEDIWKEFSGSFGCSLLDIAGKTDKIFANFRGLVLSAPGAPAGQQATPLFRFSPRPDLGDTYPNAIVKAYWPFIRRTRSEADHRDWIACGVFDWRALYITALGGQSDFDAGDETQVTDLDGPGADGPQKDAAKILRALQAETTIKSDIPAGFVPLRRLHEGKPIRTALKELKALPASEDAAVRVRMGTVKASFDDIPRTPQGDRPAPFRYLFLTCGEPHRRQIGRMVDRVNLLGTVRLYAMKNFTIIRDADVHVRIYGQLLDQAMRRATHEANKFHRTWWPDECDRLLAALGRLSAHKRFGKLEAGLRDELRLCEEKLQEEKAELDKAQCRLKEEEKRLREEEKQFGIEPRAVPETEPRLYEELYLRCRRLLADITDTAQDPKVKRAAPDFFKEVEDELALVRKSKSKRDEDLALINRETDILLMRIKTYIDELGREAIGGLPYRINRSRYYAEMYRRMIASLRVGTIDTWWDYRQFALRGVEPAFRFIKSVGDRLEKLRVRLRDAMEAVQTSSIANQTEATRDNTFQLEVIAREIRDVNQSLSKLQSILSILRSGVYVFTAIATVAAVAIGVYLGNPIIVKIFSK